MFQLIAAALTLHTQMKYFFNILLLTFFTFFIEYNSAGTMLRLYQNCFTVR